MGSLRLIHRDLHDGPFLLATDAAGDFTDNGVGLLDFELMASCDPALDLANLVEHLLLRRRQGVLADAESAVEALLTGSSRTKIRAAELLPTGRWRRAGLWPCTPSGAESGDVAADVTILLRLGLSSPQELP